MDGLKENTALDFALCCIQSMKPRVLFIMAAAFINTRHAWMHGTQTYN